MSLLARTWRREVADQQRCDTGWYLASMERHYAAHPYPADIPMVSRYWEAPPVVSRLARLLEQSNALVAKGRC